MPLREFTATFRKAFLEDAKTLNIEIPERTPNATDHIPTMVALIQKLIDKGAAYVSDDGSVYFRIASFPKYGCLCHLDLANLISGARVNQDEYEKEGVGDFVLWKKWTPADGDVGWDSPWGKGRPGLAHRVFRAEHGASRARRSTSTAAAPTCAFRITKTKSRRARRRPACPSCGSWFHVEHLLVDGQKMSKSLGNMYTVRDVLARGYTGRELRYALLTGAHYSKNLNFTWQGMDDAKTALARIDEWRKRLQEFLLGEEPVLSSQVDEIVKTNLDSFTDKTIQDFLAGELKLVDGKPELDKGNLELNGLLGLLFITIRATHRAIDLNQLSKVQAQELLDRWQRFDRVLGLGEPNREIPADVQDLLDQRAAARKAKDFTQSDALRKQIEALGWKVKDVKERQELSPL